MSTKLDGELGCFLRFETKGLERLQTVQDVNGSTNSQKDGGGANFACGKLQVMSKHAGLLIGGF